MFSFRWCLVFYLLTQIATSSELPDSMDNEFAEFEDFEAEDEVTVNVEATTPDPAESDEMEGW